MGLARKLALFKALVGIGFKEIEVSFPSSSQVEFDFTRQLIEEGHVPRDVTIQVLTQSREDLIERTVDSLRGSHRAIVHLYNAISPLHRRVVFGTDVAGVTEIAVRGVEWIKERAKALTGTEVILEYSPETFTATELEASLSVCEAVLETWGADAANPVILNLPATVEVSTPNVYADQIEAFLGRIKGRERVVLSLHTHNDRGTAVAATELGLLAGGERVEGTLFGNGERTGNVDLVTMALNLFSQGIDPGIDLSDLGAVVNIAEECTRLPVPARHPYAGALVFTAFSGSHQDAIRKGFTARAAGGGEGPWEIPYLPIDPRDVGRTYESVVRINSQSGKGGAAFVLENVHGLRLPRRFQIDFGRAIQNVSEETGGEVSPTVVWEVFEREYLAPRGPLELVGSRAVEKKGPGGATETFFDVTFRQKSHVLGASGNGPIDAFVTALRAGLDLDLRVTDYAEHARGAGSNAEAAAYVEVAMGSGPPCHGAGLDANIVTASLRAVVSGVNRCLGPTR